MKICFLGDAKSVHIVRWCEFFRDKGDEVILLTFRYFEISGIKVIDLGKGLSVNTSGGNIHYYKKIFFIKKIIKELQPDIVNAHYLTSYGLLGALSFHKKLVVSTWGSDILVTPKKNLFYKKLTQFVLHKSKLVTSDSDFMTKEINNLGIFEDKVITAPMGIDSSMFNLKGKQEKFNSRNILSLRTLCKNSNIDIIIKAFNRLSKEYVDVKLVIANDGDYRDEIIKLIQSLDLNEKIELLGSVSREKVVDLMRNNYLYISIPTSDSTSVSLLEAMASGILPIVSAIPANLEWIKDEYNGFVVDSINEISLYETMKRALVKENFINEAARINSDIINRRAIWENNMNYVRSCYLKLIIRGC